jgi:solute carrier family 8 (sodium/calcium exchanger)
LKVSIIIRDNDEWEPDKSFIVELYEPKTGYSLKGKDTKCSVMIIDDDNPGTLTFEKTDISVFASQNEVVVSVTRKNGCKGYISCKYKTVELEDRENKAVPAEDYEVTEGTITF